MMLQKKYNRDDFLTFQKQFLPDFTKDIRPVDLRGLQVTKDVVQLGYSDQLDLKIFEFTHTSSSDPRVSLTRDGFRVMKDSATYLALAAYHSDNSNDWRLSLMTANLDINEKGKVKKAFSDPRRYSFFLGPDAKIHTPEEFLINQGVVKDVKNLISRFSIEVVNKDFYTQIAILFTQLAGGKRTIGRKSIDAGRGLLNLPSTIDDTLDKEFTVRLIGRLVFCWFLKKKRSEKNLSLLPEELLSSKAVAENKGYYHNILEPLFFEILNEKPDKRQGKYKEAPWSQIPFLNGGLFTPHYHDFYEPGPLGISKHVNTLKVPDDWIKEIFEIFETYNFTIDENTSIDVELSIEPEMLGRIFENLLAEINPETGETARKATGSFYTPRPIVEYMVDESIKQYLLTKTKLNDEKIKSLLTYEGVEVRLSEAERDSILSALDTLKVIDPACGSGAFPMGVLQKLLLILQKVDPESQNWLDKKLSNIQDASLRRDLKAKLKDDNFNYIHKIGIIRDSIYGVDIQPIAVEISKLRFFLSLIVDEKVDDAKENRGIKPLPNLEFKFVCANSLIALPKKDQQPSFFTEATEDIATLKSLRDEYLGSSGAEKRRLEKKFLEVQSRMAKHALSGALWGGEKSQTLKLAQWDPFSDEPCSWFDHEWMFGVKDGFDIVIGNPPYVQLRDMPDQQQKVLMKSSHLDVAKGGRLNMFQFFISQAISICKSNGIITMITQNSIIGEETATNCRKFIFSNCKILEFSSFPERDNTSRRVFEGVKMSVCVSILQKKQADDFSFRLKIWKERQMHNYSQIALTKRDIMQIYPNNYQVPLVTQTTFNLLKKIRSHKAYYLANSSAGEIDMTKYQSLFKSEGQYRVIHGAQVQRYSISNTPSQGKINYLDARDIASNNRAKELINSKRIVMQRITGVDSEARLIMTIINDKYICANSTNYILEDSGKSLEYTIGILNSRLINMYFKLTSTNTNITAREINNIPIPIPPSKAVQNIMKNFVEYILVLRKGNQDSSFFEHLIDAMVYELYLTSAIKSTGCEVLKYLNNFPELKDDWSDEKKTVVIEMAHKELSEPKHPACVAMSKMFEIDDIKIIEGKI
jgi:adenine-specific DNA-methyltransferase